MAASAPGIGSAADASGDARPASAPAAVPVLAHRDFSAGDFSRLWRSARIAALKPLITKLPPLPAQLPQAGQELRLLRFLPAERRDDALRGVFDNSWKLGRSAVRYLGLQWELSDLHEVLTSVGIACLTGRWTQHNGALVLNRAGCAPARTIGSFYCDYWREAIDGLVMGVGGDERYAGELGARRLFWKVAQKPGKPVFAALRDGVPLLGLPGNPASVLVNLLVYVRRSKAWRRRARISEPACSNRRLKPTPSAISGCASRCVSMKRAACG